MYSILKCTAIINQYISEEHCWEGDKEPFRVLSRRTYLLTYFRKFTDNILRALRQDYTRADENHAYLCRLF